MNITEIIRRVLFRAQGKVIRLRPRGKSRGNVLISYITLSYLNTTERALNAHSNRFESIDMARAFVERGYAVDMIDITNNTFIPRKKYDFFIDNYHHMERLAPLLGPGCVKIFHATTAHWKFNNDAEQKRFDDLFARRGVRLSPDRPLPQNRALELCSAVTLLGNDFTAGTYAHGGKEIIRIPVSTTHMFENPEHKDFDSVRKNFIWFGGAGVIHKGLDLAVEAFAKMPEYSLTICGKLDGEVNFKKIYEKELSLPNIRIAGFMDPGSDTFKNLCNNSIGLVYPSCSEGQAGSVVLAMHAGLIPIISYESGVTVDNFGTILKENSIEEITRAVKELSSAPAETLKSRSVAAWEYVRSHHTREVFAREYRKFADMLISRYRV
jgi:glycosyltransferase involved in cell wall biosynthesis